MAETEELILLSLSSAEKVSNDKVPKEGNLDEAIDWDDNGEEDEDARLELALPRHGVEITNIGKNMFMFQFHHWKNKYRVIEEQPWHFDRHALLLGDITDSIKPSDTQLHHLPMWIRVYNLPLKGRLNLSNVEKIGNKLGIFVKMDNAAQVGIDKSIRLRVLIDVRRPLVKLVKLKMCGGVEENFEVKYEKPPIFCFFCGRIRHGVKDCEDCRDIEDPAVPYGNWLKASPWKYNTNCRRADEGSEGGSCARPLFVTKPKESEGEVSKGSGGKEGTSKQWKRFNRDGDHNMVNNINIAGEKRRVREGGIGADLLGISGEETSNKRRTIEAETDKVASPTQWALGEGRRRSGGLAMLWKGSMDVTVMSFSLNHIDVWVKEDGQDAWRFTGFYGHLEDENKHLTGALMKSLTGVHGQPWLCGGDFNLMLTSNEKKGGRDFDNVEAEILREAVNFCELVDMGFIGHDFTWTNNRGGKENVQERLDKYFANIAWKDCFPGSFVTHLSKRRSDHLPILLCIKNALNFPKKKKKKVKLYRFEEMWLRDEMCADIVSEAWDYGGDLCSKIACT
uniref:Zinc knuckle CX2CX4HX4C domain-containing protein n=1 Tax=Chenopodium quinoa TaxID=63459 RepID=A0A803LHG7_CHEQI